MTETDAMCMTPFLASCNTYAPLFAVFLAQSVIILKQGLMRNHVAQTAIICIFFNAFLFAFATFLNFGTTFLEDNFFFLTLRWVAAIVLFIYGFTIFYNAKQVGRVRMYMLQDKPPIIAVALLIFIVTLFNPHAYEDSYKLFQSVGHGNAMVFAFLGILISSAWLVCLTKVVERYESVMQKDFVWKILDVFLGLLLWATALNILLPDSCLCF